VKISELVTIVFNAAALFFVGAQVLLARRALKEGSEAQQQQWTRIRRQATIEAWMSTARYRESLTGILPWNDRDPEEVASFLRKINGDHKKLAPVRQYLNYLDNLAVGIKQGTLDIETISMLSGSRIIDIISSYKPHIDNVRRELNRPEIYSSLEDLVDMIAHTNEFARIQMKQIPADQLLPISKKDGETNGRS
jgi:hypothetical protein